MNKEDFKGKTFFITGASKNCGKTTYLNYLCNTLRDNIDFARLTIGIDGERQDRLFGNKKPGVYVQKDDIFVTTDEEIMKSGIDHNVLQVFPYKTVAGRIALFQAKREGRIELIGPEKNDQLNELIFECKNYSDVVFVDGALNRMTHMSGIVNASMIYVKFVNNTRLKKDIEEIEKILILNEIKKAHKNKENFYFNGALTENTLKDLPKKIILCVEDITKIFLSKIKLEELVEEGRIFVKNRIPLNKIILNCKGISENELKKKLNKKYFLNYIEFNPYSKRRV